MRLLVFVLTLSGCLFLNGIALACDVCQKQQPKLLRTISHGAGPDGTWDYVIVAAVAVAGLTSLICAVKWLVKPGEKEADHIKRSILEL
jgi:hypothetical protein